jgi:hypothetical protein
MLQFFAPNKCRKVAFGIFHHLRKVYIPIAVFASDDVIVFGGFLHNNFVDASLGGGGDGSNAAIYFFSNLNHSFSNVLDLRNLQVQVKKSILFQKLF